MSKTQDVAAETQPPVTEVMETRFGAIEVSREKPVIFENGMLGIPDSRQFTLMEFPADNLRQFKLLQSLDNENLSFITLPLELDNAILARADIEKACEDINLPIEELALLLIVSVHRSPSKVTLSVNARAPLLIQADTLKGTQYVFQHSRYKVQQVLNLNE